MLKILPWFLWLSTAFRRRFELISLASHTFTASPLTLGLTSGHFSNLVLTFMTRNLSFSHQASLLQPVPSSAASSVHVESLWP